MGMRQVRAWTMKRAFTIVREALNSAYVATSIVTILVTVDASPVAWIACAARPTMPDRRARSAGSSPAAFEPRPNPKMITNTYGTMKRKNRNATAPASMGPPTLVSCS
jgi:hypothetical protein